ncbi:MAG TPA: NAD(P)H-hydrate dehydratase [Terriglobales bacterium]|nr:NAD(P)H-hydrate dehydratase [Terriglobales bacterium]
MKIVTAAEMREIDRLTTDKHKIPSLMLMENAGTAVARFILRQYPDAKRITVVCGKGNNGGDGFVASRKLHEAGKEVTTVLLAAADDVKGDAAKMLKLLPAPPDCIRTPQKAYALRDLSNNADVLVDAIFGTGFRSPLPELAAKAIALISETRAPVISVDVPSGADSDSFAIDQPGACRSSAIVSFTAPKPAILFAALTSGPIVVANIGSPDDLIRSNLGIEWNDPPTILSETRPLNSNKGLYGHVIIIGGSRGKSGAPTMASIAALRIGAGLVTCAVPASILPVVAGSTPELMTEGLDETDNGTISSNALRESELTRILGRKNVVALGPGLGRDPETVNGVRKFVGACSLPLVIDADGLNAFEGERSLLSGAKRRLVLTPHPGEMARLMGSSVREIESNRIEVAREFAREHRLVLVLKGWRTLIADADGRIWVNTTGNPGLAKGGSGDVLTGMIAGMIAQYPQQIAEAVRAAVYLHGMAADCALDDQTERTMLATDVIAALPQAFRIAQQPYEFTWIQGGAQCR